MTDKTGKILMVDDDEDVLQAARFFLKKHVESIHTESNPENIPNLLHNDSYDVILLDAPPNLGLATWSVLTASEGVIIPLEAQDYSVKGTGNLHAVIQKVRKRTNPHLTILGYVINRYDGRRRIEQDFKSMIEQHLGEKVFKQVLKDSVIYVEAVTLKKPITYLAPKSEQAQAFRQIGKEVLNVQNL